MKKINRILPIRRTRLRRVFGGVMIEAMITLFLFSVTGIACVSLLMTSIVASRRAVENNQAYNAGRQAIENVRLYKGNKIAVGVYKKADVLAIGDLPQLAQLSEGDVSMTVSNWTRADIKFIRVTVGWQGLGGNRERKTRVLTSLIAERGTAE